MKKRKFFVIAAMAASLMGLTTSCLKDGWNDFEALRHPVYLDGHFNPELGIPVGHAGLTVRQMLNYFSADNAFIYVTEDSVVGLTLDTMAPFDIRFSELSELKRFSKEGDTGNVRHVTNIIHGEAEVALLKDFYDSIDFDLQLKNLLASLSADLHAECSERTRQLVDEAGLDASVDSIVIEAVGHNGATQVALTPSTALSIQNFLNGETVSLLDRTDLSELVNVKPYRFGYTFRLNTSIATGSFASAAALYRFVTDTLELQTLHLNINFAVDFPLSLSLSNLKLDTCMKMDPVAIEYDLEVGNIQVDSSALIMEFDNSLPLTLALGAQIVDSVSGDAVDIFDGGRVQIEGGALTYNDHLGTYVVAEPKKSVIRVTLDHPKINALARCNKLRFQVGLSSAAHEGQYPIVSVQTTDGLGINVYVQARADLNIHTPIITKPILNK